MNTRKEYAAWLVESISSEQAAAVKQAGYTVDTGAASATAVERITEALAAQAVASATELTKWAQHPMIDGAENAIIDAAPQIPEEG